MTFDVYFINKILFYIRMHLIDIGAPYTVYIVETACQCHKVYFCLLGAFYTLWASARLFYFSVSVSWADIKMPKDVKTVVPPIIIL